MSSWLFEGNDNQNSIEIKGSFKRKWSFLNCLLLIWLKRPQFNNNNNFNNNFNNNIFN
jgi:hypothetical protein